MRRSAVGAPVKAQANRSQPSEQQGTKTPENVTTRDSANPEGQQIKKISGSCRQVQIMKDQKNGSVEIIENDLRSRGCRISAEMRLEKNAIAFFDFHDSAVEDFTKKSFPPPGSLNQSDPAADATPTLR